MCFRILHIISKDESDSVQDCEFEGPNLGALIGVEANFKGVKLLKDHGMKVH